MKTLVVVKINPLCHFLFCIFIAEVWSLTVNADGICPIEIKKAKNPADADKNFKVLEKLNLPLKSGLILCMVDELVPYNKDVWLCPISLI